MRDTAAQLVLALGTSPGIQRTMVLHEFVRNEVVRAKDTFIDAGGKAAFASRVLRQLGVPVKYLSHGGSNQAEYESLLDQDGFPYHLIHTRNKIRHCTTVVELDPASSETEVQVSAVTELVEPSASVELETGRALYSLALANMSDASVLLLAGSMAPGYEVTLYADLVKAALEANIFTVLDIRGEELLHAFGLNPHVIKINIDEFTRTFLPEKTGFVEHCESAHSDNHKELLAECLIDLTEDTSTSIILSRGPSTVWCGWQGKFVEFKLPLIPRQRILNPIGSGDAFTAGIAAWAHANMSEKLVQEGLSEQGLAAAVQLGIRCAQENTRLLRPGRIR